MAVISSWLLTFMFLGAAEPLCLHGKVRHYPDHFTSPSGSYKVDLNTRPPQRTTITQWKDSSVLWSKDLDFYPLMCLVADTGTVLLAGIKQESNADGRMGRWLDVVILAADGRSIFQESHVYTPPLSQGIPPIPGSPHVKDAILMASQNLFLLHVSVTPADMEPMEHKVWVYHAETGKPMRRLDFISRGPNDVCFVKQLECIHSAPLLLTSYDCNRFFIETLRIEKFHRLEVRTIEGEMLWSKDYGGPIRILGEHGSPEQVNAADEYIVTVGKAGFSIRVGSASPETFVIKQDTGGTWRVYPVS